MTDWIRRWVEESPFGRALGVRAEAVDGEAARLSLVFRQDNSNGDQALHGGVAASMIDLASQAVARGALGAESGPWHTVAIQVGYLAAALGESITSEARLLRRGKELAYAEVVVTGESGREVARGLTTVRGRFGDPAAPLPDAQGDAGGTDRGAMGPFIHKVPFHGKLGIRAEHMAGGVARLVMPFQEENADASGGVHEGAILGLLDTTGAMAGWAETGPGRFKASTPGIQARFLAPPDAADLVGFGRVRLRDREMLFSEVEIARADDRRLVAQGTVNYRIITPEAAR
ncbi:MAG: PaaI family thioesterase [Myxococcota bacterium]